MSKDREELNDLSAAMPDKVKAMSALWEAWAWRCHVYPAPAETARTQSTDPASVTLGD
jgi:hypothetical protein